MGSPERPLGYQTNSAREQTRDAVHLRGLNRLLKRERRKDAGESFSEHRFSRARRPDHQDIVPPGGRHFQRALGSGLAANFAKVRKGGVGWRHSAGGTYGWLKLIGLVQILD